MFEEVDNEYMYYDYTQWCLSSLSTTLSLEEPKNFLFDTKHEESEKQEGLEKGR